MIIDNFWSRSDHVGLAVNVKKRFISMRSRKRMHTNRVSSSGQRCGGGGVPLQSMNGKG